MFNDIPSEVVLAFSILIVSVVSSAATWLVAKTRAVAPEVTNALLENLPPSTLEKISWVAEKAVRAAQQARLNEKIENTGRAAFDYAVGQAKRLLSVVGLEEIDVEALADIIEATYHELKPVLKNEVETFLNRR